MHPTHTTSNIGYHNLMLSDDRSKGSTQPKNSFAATVESQNPDPIALSQKIAHEINDLSSGGNLTEINNDLQNLQNAIPACSDKDKLNTLETNMEAFYQNGQPYAQFDSVRDLVINIKMAIYTKQLSLSTLSDQDKNTLLHKILAVLGDVMKKLDQFSIEQITDLNNRLAGIEKTTASLGQQISDSISKEITILQGDIDKKIQDAIIQATQRDKILEFKATLLDYLEGRGDFNLLIAKQEEINWDESTEQIILAVVTQFFTMDKFPLWINFQNGIAQGVKGLCDPNPGRANKIKASLLDIIKNQNILSVVNCHKYGGFFPANCHFIPFDLISYFHEIFLKYGFAYLEKTVIINGLKVHWVNEYAIGKEGAVISILLLSCREIVFTIMTDDGDHQILCQLPEFCNTVMQNFDENAKAVCRILLTYSSYRPDKQFYIQSHTLNFEQTYNGKALETLFYRVEYNQILIKEYNSLEDYRTDPELLDKIDVALKERTI